MLPSELPGILQRIYDQIYGCLPRELKVPDCRLTAPGRCPAVQSCSPLNGFIGTDGLCTPGLFLVTGDLTRLQEADGTCISKWGLIVDVYLLLPCKPTDPCGRDNVFAVGSMWALGCCLNEVNLSAAINPNFPDGWPCERLIINPTIQCLQEGTCRGAKATITIPLP